MASSVPKTSRMVELSNTIAETTATLDAHHTANQLASLSFDSSGPCEIEYPPDVAQARIVLLDAIDELNALVTGPVDAWTKPLHTDLIVKQAIYRYRIANSFPAGKDEATYAELAEATGLDESNLRRLVRAAMTSRIFRESSKGIVAHTAASKLFAENEHLQQWVGMVTEELWPAATKVVDALAKFLRSQEPHQAGFNLAHNTDQPIFAYLADKPDRAKRFADAMSMFNTGRGYEPEHLLDHYDWAALGKATLVDVGGSHGSVAVSIARRFPDITCIVQDRPEVIATANVPKGLEDRLSFQSPDLFQPQTVKDADLHYFRWIFHDWADKYAAQILQNLVLAMKPGVRVIVNEYIVPDPGVIPAIRERDTR